MPKQRYTCGYCGCAFSDYATNRKKSKSGEFFCSMSCKGKYQTAIAIERAPVKIKSQCVKCNQIKPVSEFYQDKKCRANGGVQYACKECVKAERKIYYDENVEEVNQRVQAYRRLHPGRKSRPPYSSARRKLNSAVESGKVIKATACQHCGKEGWLHGHHHRGYDRPLDVVWLCPSCHHAAHGRGPKARSTAINGAQP